MVLDAVDDLLPRRGLERLGVGIGQCCQWRFGCVVAREQCRVVWAAMVVRAESRTVQVVDGVRPDVVLFGHVARPVGRVFLSGQRVEWSVRFVTGVSFT